MEVIVVDLASDSVYAASLAGTCRRGESLKTRSKSVQKRRIRTRRQCLREKFAHANRKLSCEGKICCNVHASAELLSSIVAAECDMGDVLKKYD